MANSIQIAAMAPPAQNGQGSLPKGTKGISEKSPDRSSPTFRNKPYIDSPSAQLHREMQNSMSRLALGERINPQASSDADVVPRAGLRFDDELTHISCSSTKQTSSDSRSATSGATYALDEKESLRPDDSASTKAAEDEDSYSGAASGAPSSRVGSEAGGRAFRDQFNEISERIGPGLHRLQSMNRRGIPGIVEEGPQPTLAPRAPSVPAPTTGPDTLATSGPSFVVEYKGPDDKLFEALDSPKDRLFLVRLEQEVISFIKDSTEPILDLPPCNSFCRLLAHKLADYYALTHYVDNAVSSVRLYRTPYCRIPTPLSVLAKQTVPRDTTPMSQPSMKIMRREGLGKDGANAGSGANTNSSSMAPSKANSEMGDDSQRGTGFVSPTDSANAKERANMTREEREAKYKETRERIFKDFEDTDSADATHSGDVNGMSRTSSGTGKKKSKKSRNHDDGFEARSQFNAYYPAVQYPTVQYPATTYEQAASTMAYFSPYSPQQGNMMGQGMIGTAMLQNAYNQGYQSMPSGPIYPNGMQNPVMPGTDTVGPNTVGMQSYPGYSPQFPPQYYQQMMQQPIMGQQSPVMPSPTLSSHPQLSRPSSQMSDQGWAQNGYPYSYQQSAQTPQSYSPQMHHRSPVAGIPSVPYQFGQLPYQPHSPQGKPPHPLPGSYNRQAFNPQTRAFVPSSGFNPQASQYGGIPSDGVMRSPMSFQSGSSTSPYGKQAATYQQSNSYPKSSVANSTPRTSSQQNSPQPSSLAKWGTPANLPPKPPPPEAPAMPESLPTNPTSMYGPISVQPMIHGQPMPTYQNGVYGMPGGNQ